MKEARESKRRDEPPEGSNEALIKDFFTQLIAGRKKWIVPDKMFCELSFFRILDPATLSMLPSCRSLGPVTLYILRTY